MNKLTRLDAWTYGPNYVCCVPCGQGTFSRQVKVPDTYGVFKWVLQYHRPGYSYIDMTETVPIRPFRHDEYERFIQQVGMALMGRQWARWGGGLGWGWLGTKRSLGGPSFSCSNQFLMWLCSQGVLVVYL